MKTAASATLPVAGDGVARSSFRLGAALRSSRRALRLLGEVVLAAVEFGAAWIRCRGVPPLSVRALCLQSACRRVLRVFNADLFVSGIPPNRGLLVCNHLSYLDILVLGATTPCVFVSKSDVRHWPVFGWFAALAGTRFIRRDRRADVRRMTCEIREALGDQVLVVLFPEGTSTGGATVLPFKSALLGSVESTGHSVAPAAIGYALDDGNPAEEVCYWKDMTLVPHLWNLLGKRSPKVVLAFGVARPVEAEDRKATAARLHSEVLELKRSIDAKFSL